MVYLSPSDVSMADVARLNSWTEPMMVLGARLSSPDPRLNVGFREGTVIGAGEGMDDAVRLVYAGAAVSPAQGSTVPPGEPVSTRPDTRYAETVS